jgi:hypothetical protein
MSNTENLKIILIRKNVDSKLAEAFLKAHSAYLRNRGR